MDWKGGLKATRNVGKGLHKVFKTVVKQILLDLPPLRDSGSGVSHFFPEPRNSTEVTKLSDDIKKSGIKATQKEIKNIINNQTFLVEYSKNGEPVTTCMDV